MLPLEHHHIECFGCQRHRAIFTVFFYLEIIAIKFVFAELVNNYNYTIYLMFLGKQVHRGLYKMLVGIKIKMQLANNNFMPRMCGQSN